jgi:hypothetical protein
MYGKVDRFLSKQDACMKQSANIALDYFIQNQLLKALSTKVVKYFC